MLLDDSIGGLASVLLAILLDVWLGEPGWLWRRVPHPVVLAGRLIAFLDRHLFAPGRSPFQQRARGVAALAVLGVLAVALGATLHLLCAYLPFGWMLEGGLMFTLIAWRSLIDHVEAVRRGLESGLDEGRRAVSAIVGRDPQSLDEAATGRAAIESLAENFSDGVVAPVLFAALFGLPGLFLYKAVNTADSMIGHRSARYLHCGWATARLDDLLNLAPARLTAMLIAISATFIDRGGASWRQMWRCAPLHRSPNAGWPEAACAGALDLRLAGPRVYGGVEVADGWMGDGRSAVVPDDIRRAIALCTRAYTLLVMALGVVLGVALFAS